LHTCSTFFLKKKTIFKKKSAPRLGFNSAGAYGTFKLQFSVDGVDSGETPLIAVASSAAGVLVSWDTPKNLTVRDVVSRLPSIQVIDARGRGLTGKEPKIFVVEADSLVSTARSRAVEFLFTFRPSNRKGIIAFESMQLITGIRGTYRVVFSVDDRYTIPSGPIFIKPQLPPDFSKYIKASSEGSEDDISDLAGSDDDAYNVDNGGDADYGFDDETQDLYDDSEEGDGGDGDGEDGEDGDGDGGGGDGGDGDGEKGDEAGDGGDGGETEGSGGSSGAEESGSGDGEEEEEEENGDGGPKECDSIADDGCEACEPDDSVDPCDPFVRRSKFALAGKPVRAWRAPTLEVKLRRLTRAREAHRRGEASLIYGTAPRAPLLRVRSAAAAAGAARMLLAVNSSLAPSTRQQTTSADSETFVDENGDPLTVNDPEETPYDEFNDEYGFSDAFYDDFVAADASDELGGGGADGGGAGGEFDAQFATEPAFNDPLVPGAPVGDAFGDPTDPGTDPLNFPVSSEPFSDRVALPKPDLTPLDPGSFSNDDLQLDDLGECATIAVLSPAAETSGAKLGIELPPLTFRVRDVISMPVTGLRIRLVLDDEIESPIKVEWKKNKIGLDW
jgi:uncharacterized membrane protein YgcG